MKDLIDTREIHNREWGGRFYNLATPIICGLIAISSSFASRSLIVSRSFRMYAVSDSFLSKSLINHPEGCIGQ